MTTYKWDEIKRSSGDPERAARLARRVELELKTIQEMNTMDDPNKKKEDALRVSLQQHEVQHLCQKFGVLAQVVVDVIKSHGPMRVDVERELQRLIDTSRS